MKLPLRLAPLTCSIAALIGSPALADSIKANNNTPLNDPASWASGGVPGAGDWAIWDSTFTAVNTATSLPTMGASMSWYGMRVTNVGGTRHSNFIAGIEDAAPFKTLTLGAGGIDMSNALQAFRFRVTNIVLAADQTWNIADANTGSSPAGLGKNEDLSFFPTTTGVSLNLAGYELTKTGAGTLAFAAGLTVTSSTSGASLDINEGIVWIQSGGSRTTTVTDAVPITVNSGGSLRLGVESAPPSGIALQLNGAINLNDGSHFLVGANQAATLNIAGAINVTGNVAIEVTGTSTSTLNFNGNLLGTGDIAYANTASNAGGNRLILNGDNSGFSGSITLNGASGSRSLRLASANSGSAAAEWIVDPGNTIEVAGVSVQLGTLSGLGIVNASSGTGTINVGSGSFGGVLANGAGTLALNKLGAGTLTLTGANTYTGATNVLGGTLLLTANHAANSPVSVGDNATLGVRLITPGATLDIPSLVVGSATGGRLLFETFAFGNPTAPMLNAGAFSFTGSTSVDVTGSDLTTGTFPLISYGGALGGNFGDLSLTLPFRVAGNLQNSPGLIEVNITGVDTPKWNGNVSGDWDIDPDNTGTLGTANWLTKTSNMQTRYVQTPTLIDTVLFDDSAEGTTNINLTTTISPNGVLVSNDSKTYTFGGSGKLSGAVTLVKQGSGTLVLANDQAYDNTGGIEINAGRLEIGDGVTPGLGITSVAPIKNNATLAFNRPDDFTVGTQIVGDGTISKENSNTVTLSNALSTAGNISIAEGTLRFSSMASLSGNASIEGDLEFASGALLSGVLSGDGGIILESGTLELTGTDPNTFGGTTTINGGTLQLSKETGVDAIGGTVIINGAGTLSVAANTNQFADDVTLIFNKTAPGSVALNGETIGTLMVTAGGEATQIQGIGAGGLTVMGLTTVSDGMLAIGSSSTGNLNGGLVITGGIVRIAAQSGPTVLNIPSGGIVASGGEIQVKFNTNNNSATLNLGGDLTATGDLVFTNGGYAGASANVVNLIGDRTFDIDEDATVTFFADLGGTGSLTKTGEGTLLLNPSSDAAYSGPTEIEEGTIVVNGSLTGHTVIVRGGVLAGNGLITPNSSGLTVSESGRLAPGTDGTVGTLTINAAAGGGVNIDDIAPGSLLFDLETVASSDKISITGGTLNIGTGFLEWDHFAFSGIGSLVPDDQVVLFQSTNMISGSLSENLSGPLGPYIGTLSIGDGGKDLILTIAVPEPGSMTLLLAGLGVAIGARRNRRRSS